MELAIPAPAEVKYIRHPDCFCCIGHHLSDSHVHNNTIVVFDSPLNPSPGIGFAAIKLAREYTRKPSISLLAPNGTSHVDCTRDCVNSEVKPKGPPPSPKKRDIDSRIKEHDHEEPDDTVFAFLALPREIRDYIYVYVIESSKEHWGVMTASIPWVESGHFGSSMGFEYSFNSRQLQLLCRQIRMEVLEICQMHAQDIRLRGLDVDNVEVVLNIFKRQEILRRSARNITLVYSTPMLPRGGRFNGRSKDRCSFLTQIIDPFLSLIKLCPNVDSVLVSLVADDPFGYQSQFAMYVPCHDRDETTRIQVNYQWYKVAEWERIIRKHFSLLRKGIQPDMENMAFWVYTCGCNAMAQIDIVVSDGEQRRADLGAQRIKATIMERKHWQDELEEDISDGEEGQEISED